MQSPLSLSGSFCLHQQTLALEQRLPLPCPRHLLSAASSPAAQGLHSGWCSVRLSGLLHAAEVFRSTRGSEHQNSLSRHGLLLTGGHLKVWYRRGISRCQWGWALCGQRLVTLLRRRVYSSPRPGLGGPLLLGLRHSPHAACRCPSQRFPKQPEGGLLRSPALTFRVSCLLQVCFHLVQFPLSETLL